MLWQMWWWMLAMIWVNKQQPDKHNDENLCHTINKSSIIIKEIKTKRISW